MKHRRTPPTAPPRGFTLIEILVVVIIIGILAAVALPGFSGATEQARQNAFEANLRDVAGAASLYYQKFGALPEQAAGAAIPTELFTEIGRDDAAEFPLHTPLGGCWHLGNMGGRWGVGVWWPGDEQGVAGRANKIDASMDDGNAATGRFVQETASNRYYWLVD